MQTLCCICSLLCSVGEGFTAKGEWAGSLVAAEKFCLGITASVVSEALEWREAAESHKKLREDKSKNKR